MIVNIFVIVKFVYVNFALLDRFKKPLYRFNVDHFYHLTICSNR